MMTDERLAKIEAGHRGCDQPLAPCDVPVLIAEVRRLREQIDDLEADRKRRMVSAL